MANYLVRLRSPFFLNETSSSASGSADLSIKINSVNQYVISKNTNSNNVVFEVSELIKDYLDVTWDGVFPYSTTTKNSLVITAEIDINFFTGTKEQRAIAAESSSQLVEHNIYGFDAYSEFNEGSNKQLVAGQLLQSNTTMYLPETGAAYVPSESSNGVTYTTIPDTLADGGTQTIAGLPITVRRICEPVYNILKVIFLNKFGALQEYYFNKKNVQSLSTNQKSYKSTIISGSTYSPLDHQKLQYNKQGSETIRMNTGYVDEGQFEPVKQIMLSELVWVQIGTAVSPINVVTNSLEKKTQINNKLVNYSLDFEFAYDILNNVR
ncbi:MAG: hypothetical protein CMJ05_01695 [Pelagibacterales bacterium]|nr:hypothetical protein [Pelagibacterales bacterium]|tara:strand:+ start:1242 stop:2210 length:969 start_codon:yes stop_codon:yes gene_type:complete